MFSTTDVLHTAVLCVIDITAIVANAILVYAILTRTPPSMRSYSILLLNNVFVDVISATCSMLSVARLIYIGDFLQLYVYVGACSRIGAWFCHMCETIHSYLVCHSTVVLLHSFCFRLYVVRETFTEVSVPSSRMTFATCLVFYCPTVLMMVSLNVSHQYAQLERCMEQNVEIHRIGINISDYRMVIAMTYLVLLSPSSIITIYLVRRRLLAVISKMVSE
ncbi:hypothetical protein PENTCL1PPCAC_30207 [Pristionchus entomophagus]|uniref:G-protein coupled receptors family 1 profile domain-containing protein n=1 Tax=Pristionchus entomophagus TaxID=358040 RepID=A0AAV5UPF1_9BILA|nr:hypothetical protein PENTCL1PPCAC_30207 [Pristionchus entomophagus]